MPTHQQNRHLPYTPAQLFALVLDIERYPEFVPGYRSARIERRDERSLAVVQSIGLGPAALSFRSRADFEPSQWVRIHAEDGPFRRLEVEWRFRPEGEGCHVEFRVDYRLQGPLAGLVRGWLGLTAPRLLESFARRAEQIFGQSPPRPG